MCMFPVGHGRKRQINGPGKKKIDMKDFHVPDNKSKSTHVQYVPSQTPVRRRLCPVPHHLGYIQARRRFHLALLCMYLPGGVLLIAYPPLHPARPTTPVEAVPCPGAVLGWGLPTRKGSKPQADLLFLFFLFWFFFFSFFKVAAFSATPESKRRLGRGPVPNRSSFSAFPPPPPQTFIPFHPFHPFHGEPWTHKSHPSLSASSCSFRRGRFVWPVWQV